MVSCCLFLFFLPAHFSLVLVFIFAILLSVLFWTEIIANGSWFFSDVACTLPSALFIIFVETVSLIWLMKLFSHLILNQFCFYDSLCLSVQIFFFLSELFLCLVLHFDLNILPLSDNLLLFLIWNCCSICTCCVYLVLCLMLSSLCIHFYWIYLFASFSNLTVTFRCQTFTAKTCSVFQSHAAAAPAPVLFQSQRLQEYHAMFKSKLQLYLQWRWVLLICQFIMYRHSETKLLIFCCSWLFL